MLHSSDSTRISYWQWQTHQDGCKPGYPVTWIAFMVTTICSARILASRRLLHPQRRGRSSNSLPRGRLGGWNHHGIMSVVEVFKVLSVFCSTYYSCAMLLRVTVPVSCLPNLVLLSSSANQVCYCQAIPFTRCPNSVFPNHLMRARPDVSLAVRTKSHLAAGAPSSLAMKSGGHGMSRRHSP